MKTFKCLEICAGAGGQAIGLEQAGFKHELLLEIETDPCLTLRKNRPKWRVIQQDVRTFDGISFIDKIDLFAGGVPCPPFSVAGKQLGSEDERDLFPEALRLIDEIRPRAVLLENVRGFDSAKFRPYLKHIYKRLHKLYVPQHRVLEAADFKVPQYRQRFILVALRPEDACHFRWPKPQCIKPRTVGQALGRMMASNGWPGATGWAEAANDAAPTLVGGSKKHGGADLGPTRAKARWVELMVDGRGIADHVPDASFPADGLPRLTVEMAATLQGFPRSWCFAGKKTSIYRQIGNAFPPPVAAAVGRAIIAHSKIREDISEEGLY